MLGSWSRRDSSKAASSQLHATVMTSTNEMFESVVFEVPRLLPDLPAVLNQLRDGSLHIISTLDNYLGTTANVRSISCNIDLAELRSARSVVNGSGILVTLPTSLTHFLILVTTYPYPWRTASRMWHLL